MSTSEPQITVNRLFCTPLIEVRLPQAETLVPALREVIMAQRARSPGVRRSNIHGWHSDIEMLHWGGEPAMTLARETMQACGRFTSDINGAQGQSRYEMGIEMWRMSRPPARQTRCMPIPAPSGRPASMSMMAGTRKRGRLSPRIRVSP